MITSHMAAILGTHITPVNRYRLQTAHNHGRLQAQNSRLRAICGSVQPGPAITVRLIIRYTFLGGASADS